MMATHVFVDGKWVLGNVVVCMCFILIALRATSAVPLYIAIGI